MLAAAINRMERMTIFEFGWQEESGWYCFTHGGFFPFSAGNSALVSHVQNNKPCDIGSIARLTTSGLIASSGAVPIPSTSLMPNIVQVTGSYAVQPTDAVVTIQASSNLTVTLPSMTSGRNVQIKRIDSGAAKVNVVGGSSLIDGSSSVSVIPNESVTVIGDGAQWRVV